MVVLVTSPDKKSAARLARVLVEERLAACANLVPGLRSIYRWEGKVRDESEVLLILKSRRAIFPALADRVRALHPYTVPEMLALPVSDGSAPYLRWLREATRKR